MASGEDGADLRRDLGGMGLQREVEEGHPRVGQIPPVRLGARRQEEWIVAPPHRQDTRLVGAEVILKRRIERDIALVVAEQVELDIPAWEWRLCKR